MRLRTSLNHQARAIRGLTDIYAAAKRFGISASILAENEQKLLNTIKHCPVHVKEYVRGYQTALWDHMMIFDLEVQYLINDKILCPFKGSKHYRPYDPLKTLDAPHRQFWREAEKPFTDWST